MILTPWGYKLTGKKYEGFFFLPMFFDYRVHLARQLSGRDPLVSPRAIRWKPPKLAICSGCGHERPVTDFPDKRGDYWLCTKCCVVTEAAMKGTNEPHRARNRKAEGNQVGRRVERHVR